MHVHSEILDDLRDPLSSPAFSKEISLIKNKP